MEGDRAAARGWVGCSLHRRALCCTQGDLYRSGTPARVAALKRKNRALLPGARWETGQLRAGSFPIWLFPLLPKALQKGVTFLGYTLFESSSWRSMKWALFLAALCPKLGSVLIFQGISSALPVPLSACALLGPGLRRWHKIFLLPFIL